MNTPRPSRRELDSLSEAELKERLYLDPSWGADYRGAIDRLRARASPNNNHKPESKPNAPNIVNLVTSSVGRVKMEEDSVYEENPGLGSLRPLAQAILDSGWDFIDPDSKGMTYDPPGNRSFVEDFAYRDKYWDDLVAKGQRKWNTIIDAYNRWLRHKK
jgi:hypothetical protein